MRQFGLCVGFSVCLCLVSSSVFVYLFLGVKSAFLFPCSVISCFTLAGYVHVSVLVSFVSHFHWTQSASPVVSPCLLSVPCFCGCLVNLVSCLFVYSSLCGKFVYLESGSLSMFISCLNLIVCHPVCVLFSFASPVSLV